MIRIELIAIYDKGKPYYRIEENEEISYAVGFEQARKYVEQAKGRIELADTAVIEEHSKLIRLIIMIKLRNSLIKFIETKTQR